MAKSESTTLVTGATGTVGSEVINQLASSGHRVKATVHTQGKADKFKQFPNVNIVTIDYNKIKTLTDALTGIDKLFLLTPVTPDMENISSNIIQEAKRQGIKYIVKLSVAGAEAEPGISIGRLHRREEKMIEDTKIPYSFIRPGAFMQNFVNYFGETIRKQNAIYVPAGEGKVSFIDARDIASVAVELLTNNNDTKYKNKSFELTGQEAISYGQAAEILSKQLGRKISYVDISEESARKGMKEAGMQDWFIDGLLEIYATVRAGYAAQTTNAIEDITGRKPILFSQFVKDYAEALT